MNNEYAANVGRLTSRELQVLALMAHGLSNAAIAARLSVTDKTIDAHTTRIFRKLELPPTPSMHRRVVASISYWRFRAAQQRNHTMISAV